MPSLLPCDSLLTIVLAWGEPKTKDERERAAKLLRRLTKKA
jgi:hypothetical protein